MQTPGSSTTDPESLQKPPPRLVKHDSEDHFDNTRWHLDNHPCIDRRCARTSLPTWCGQFFHPTHVMLERSDGVVKWWGSRAHRKHRYKAVSPMTAKSRRKEWFVGKLASMMRLEWWNISWWVAQSFTWGSVIWCINGFAAFLPFCNSHVKPSIDVTGWSAFIGATVFEVGSVLGVLEALSRHDAVAFSDEATEETVDHSHEHEPPKSLEEKKGRTADVHIEAVSSVPKPDQEPRRKRWIWLPNKAKYWHEMGFLAAFFQLIGATVFWISGFTALPSILTAISKHQGLLDGVFWTPQVVGGAGFIISSIFIMLEEQSIWWLPRPFSLGWQVGVWNFIGAIGFTLCGALGYSTNSGAEYQSSLATFWGSWAFLIASVLQWYECVNAV